MILPALGKARSAIADRDLSAATASLAEFRAAGGFQCRNGNLVGDP